MAKFCTGGLIFFYIVKQGKNIFFIYKKKVWKTTLFFVLLRQREHIFPHCIFICNFWYYFWVSYNYETKLRYYLAYLAYLAHFSQLHLILYLFGIIYWY